MIIAQNMINKEKKFTALFVQFLKNKKREKSLLLSSVSKQYISEKTATNDSITFVHKMFNFHQKTNDFLIKKGKKSYKELTNEEKQFLIKVKGTFQENKVYTSYSKISEIRFISIGLVSNQQIQKWSEKKLPNGKILGEVTSANTLHHKTFKPLKGGLFCERIFGPLKDFECACNIQKRPSQQDYQKIIEHQDIKRQFCPVCDVEYTWSIIRRYQMGLIKFISPVTHIWYLKAYPSYLSILLDIKRKDLEKIIYCSETLTLENSWKIIQNLSLSSSPSFLFQSWKKTFEQNHFSKKNNSSSFVQKNNSSYSQMRQMRSYSQMRQTRSYSQMRQIHQMPQIGKMQTIKSKISDYYTFKNHEYHFIKNIIDKRINSYSLLKDTKFIASSTLTCFLKLKKRKNLQKKISFSSDIHTNKSEISISFIKNIWRIFYKNAYNLAQYKITEILSKKTKFKSFLKQFSNTEKIKKFINQFLKSSINGFLDTHFIYGFLDLLKLSLNNTKEYLSNSESFKLNILDNVFLWKIIKSFLKKDFLDLQTISQKTIYNYYISNKEKGLFLFLMNNQNWTNNFDKLKTNIFNFEKNNFHLHFKYDDSRINKKLVLNSDFVNKIVYQFNRKKGIKTLQSCFQARIISFLEKDTSIFLKKSISLKEKNKDLIYCIKNQLFKKLKDLTSFLSNQFVESIFKSRFKETVIKLLVKLKLSDILSLNIESKFLRHNIFSHKEEKQHFIHIDFLNNYFHINVFLNKKKLDFLTFNEDEFPNSKVVLFQELMTYFEQKKQDFIPELLFLNFLIYQKQFKQLHSFFFKNKTSYFDIFKNCLYLEYFQNKVNFFVSNLNANTDLSIKLYTNLRQNKTTNVNEYKDISIIQQFQQNWNISIFNQLKKCHFVTLFGFPMIYHGFLSNDYFYVQFQSDSVVFNPIQLYSHIDVIVMTNKYANTQMRKFNYPDKKQNFRYRNLKSKILYLQTYKEKNDQVYIPDLTSKSSLFQKRLFLNIPELLTENKQISKNHFYKKMTKSSSSIYKKNQLIWKFSNSFLLNFSGDLNCLLIDKVKKYHLKYKTKHLVFNEILDKNIFLVKKNIIQFNKNLKTKKLSSILQSIKHSSIVFKSILLAQQLKKKLLISLYLREDRLNKISYFFTINKFLAISTNQQNSAIKKPQSIISSWNQKKTLNHIHNYNWTNLFVNILLTVLKVNENKKSVSTFFIQKKFLQIRSNLFSLIEHLHLKFQNHYKEKNNSKISRRMYRHILYKSDIKKEFFSKSSQRNHSYKNHIYSLSFLEPWSHEKNWQYFSYYFLAPRDFNDVLIPIYKDQNFNTIYISEDIQKNTTTGAGTVLKFVSEFQSKELKKMSAQNQFVLNELRGQIHYLTILLKSGFSNKEDIIELSIICRKRDKFIRQSKLIREILHKKTDPTSMILTLLPVLPPDLRPILKIQNQIAASDLNRLYQRVIYRNDRLKKFRKDPALIYSFEVKYAQRLLQEAVDNLIQNEKGGLNSESDSRGRLFKSLSESLKGKQGRFRQYLLGKRVDYSGRSVIVVGPKLKINECGLPKEMALELFLPFLIKRIIHYKFAKTIIGAKNLIKTNKNLTCYLLSEIMQTHPILLNRAPTLHRLGVQAFQAKLIQGRAILLHPLVCSAFNADFDGDQMAVHIPLTTEARAEAWKLMLARNHLISAASGDPIMLPSQDMVLGCYYLTTDPPKFTMNSFYQKSSFQPKPFLLNTNIFSAVLNTRYSAIYKNQQNIHLQLYSEFYANVNTNAKIITKQFINENQKNNISRSYQIPTPLISYIFKNKNWNFSEKNIFITNIYFNSFDDVIKTYLLHKISLHSKIWVKWLNKVEDPNKISLNEVRVNLNGSWQEIQKKQLRYFESNNKIRNQYIQTTPGRILFYKFIQQCL
jgi:DNA-directed RNA polymerase beta' subunit